jgi:hypothetical protein
MKNIVEKLAAIEKETSNTKGGYDLFALFLRDDSANKWDILVAASWIGEDNEKALRYLSEKIQRAFSVTELTQISRIVIIDDNHPELSILLQAIDVEHGSVEIKDSNFFGLPIKHAFIITSHNRQPA